MDPIKEAFQKIKQDINSLKQELNFLTSNLIETREKITEMGEIIKIIKQKQVSTQQKQIPTNSTHASTHHPKFKALKPLNLDISTGNEGASTDRQTDRQTDTSTHNLYSKSKINTDSIENAEQILKSLDNIKKQIRFKFKRLTEQELLVFSTIYQLDEEQGCSNHKLLSDKLNLSESSIRDYVSRLIKKGIPIEKKRIKNKNIQLSISSSLKKMASLSTILQLRDL